MGSKSPLSFFFFVFCYGRCSQFKDWSLAYSRVFLFFASFFHGLYHLVLISPFFPVDSFFLSFV